MQATQSVATRILAIGATLAALGTPVQAGDLGLFGAYWDTDAMGDTAGGGVKYAIGDAGLRLELRGSLFPDISRGLSSLIEGAEGDLEIEAIVPEVGVTYNFSPESRTQLYLGGGLSYYLLDASGVDVEDQLGYYGLAGLATGGDGTGFFAEVIYRSVEATVRANAIVESVDLDLSGPSIHLGILFRF